MSSPMCRSGSGPRGTTKERRITVPSASMRLRSSADAAASMAGTRPHASVTRAHRESGLWDAVFRSERPFVAGRAVRIERRQQFGVLDQMP